jgi:hypothetical protein
MTITQQKATAMRRLLARYIDLNFAALFIVLPAIYFMVAIEIAAVSPILAAVAVTVGCYMFVALEQAIFGNSAGKYILGIKVIPATGRPADLQFFVEREFKVLVLGQAFGLQIAAMIAGFYSLYQLQKHGDTHYDRNLATVIRNSHDARRLFWLIPVFAPSIILAIASLVFFASLVAAA